ncbi:MAG: glycosyltransferase family 2 protein [Anderseniella sp.]
MARILILCPTHNHADTLYFSIASAQAQTVKDWEMVVICDGAPPRTFAIMEAITEVDARITFEAHPKSYKTGEIHRDRVVRASDAEYICHLGDDDVWAPDHLEQMLNLMQRGDWVNQSAMSILNSNAVEWTPRNMGGQTARQSMGKKKFAIAVGFSHTAYRMESYLSLPEGWSQTPEAIGASDQFMSSKFLTRSDIRVASTAACSSLKFTSRSQESLALPPEGFAARIAPWLARIAGSDLIQSIARTAKMDAVLLALLSVYAPGKEQNFASAYGECGLQIVGEDDPYNVAINGAPMTLPLTADQHTQAAHAYLTYMTWFHGEVPIGDWVDQVGQSEKTWVRCLGGFSRTRPHVAIGALNELEARYGDNVLLTNIRIYLQIQAADFDAARDGLSRARRLWPKARWLDPMENQVEAAGSASSSA